MTWRWTACWMEGLRCGYRGVGSAVGAHGVYVHSVSWIRHLGMACGATFAGRCSHNLAAAAELPFASRPGDRTDRFRPTCCSSRCCSSPFNDLWPDSCISSKRTNEDTLLLFRVFIYSVAWILSMLSDLFLNHLAVLFIMAQFTAYETYCFTTQTHARAHTQTHRQTCWHAHLSLEKPPQAVALAQRHSLSWVKTLGAEKHPVKMLSISDARTDKRRRWFEEKWCWSKSNTEDASGRDAF